MYKRQFPDADEYMKWYNALSMSGAYYKKIASYTYPYGVIPAGVYHENEASDLPDKTFASHIWVGPEEDVYKRQVLLLQPTAVLPSCRGRNMRRRRSG